MTGLSLLCSYPKSGNTWLRAVLASVLGESPIKLQEGLPFKVFDQRSHFDDLMGIDSSDLTTAEIDAVRAAYCRAMAAAPDLPRIWKVHNCFQPPSTELEPPFPPDSLESVIYIVRDPRDVAVSFAHHVSKSIDEAISRMENDKQRMASNTSALNPQLSQYLSSWSLHVESWLDAPDIKLHLMRYEDMVGNPHVAFSEALRFLGIGFGSEKLEQALAACRFDVLQASEQKEGFRERPRRVRSFFRRGVAGGWRDSLTAEQEQRIVARHGMVMRRLGYLS